MSNQPLGEYLYRNVSQSRVNAIIGALKKSGAEVYGDNPWEIEIPNSGVKLTCIWISESETLSIAVTIVNNKHQVYEMDNLHL